MTMFVMKKNTTIVVEVKVKGGRVSYLERVRENDCRWKRKEGRKKMTILYI